MKPEDIVKNFEFKSWKREMKKSFPFIVNIRPMDSWERDLEDYDSVFFFEADISLEKLQEIYPHWTIWEWQRDRVNRNKGLQNLVYLSELFDSDGSPTPSEVMSEMFDMSSDFHWQLQRQQAVPDELKSPRTQMLQRFNVIE